MVGSIEPTMGSIEPTMILNYLIRI